MNETAFIHMDFDTWPRRETFYYFSKMAPTGWSVTVDVDVTELLPFLKEKGIRFFPVYLWLVTKDLSLFPEFTTAVKDGQIGYYSTLTPLYAVLHEDDHTFSLMWTEYSDDFVEFYERYLYNDMTFGDVHGILANGIPPENAYTVSEVPWVSFSHFAVHTYENKEYYLPSVEAGRFTVRDGRTYLPLSLTLHHAATDGWHVKCFLEELNKDIERFAKGCYVK